MSKAPQSTGESSETPVVNGGSASLADFLRSLPASAPAEVFEALDLFARADGPKVGPQVFFELVQQAPVAVSVTDANAKILYVNRAFELLSGYRARDILGENQSCLSNKATPVKVYRDLWRTIQDKRSWTGALVNRRKNGDAYLAELTISPVLSPNGKIRYFLGMHRDITEIHRLTTQVRHQKGMLESMLDGAPVCVALIDSRRRVILDNQEYKKLFGDLRGQEPAHLLLAALLEQNGTDIDAYRADGRGFTNVEVRLDTQGSRGPRWFSLSGNWVDEPEGAATQFFAAAQGSGSCCLLLLAHETTSHKRESERCRIAQLRATLAEQQRVGGMREALAAATFQIQQPMNLVNAAINMLQRSDGDHSLLPVLTQVAESAQQAHQALSSALPAESMGEQLQLLNLNEILQDVLQLNTDSLLAFGVVVEWLPQAVLPSITGYPKALRGLFMDLTDNAIQALKEGDGQQPQIRLTTAGRDELITVELSDNGVGLAADQTLAVFEPLHCGWRHKRGHAGMGLAIARDTVGRHDGDITIEEFPGGGCRVRVTFPSPSKN